MLDWIKGVEITGSLAIVALCCTAYIAYVCLIKVLEWLSDYVKDAKDEFFH